MRSVLTALCLFATTAHAVPAQFTHQGRLLDAEGIPLEGEAIIIFRVTNDEMGGDELWEETITVPLTNGFYSAVLGASADNPLDTEVLAQAPVWLELQLDGEPAMTPRSPVNSVPYATMATVAEEVSGGPVDASEIAVAGSPVINDVGEWVGPAPTVNWADIEDMPEGFIDGIDDDTDTDTDTDSFADLAVSCVDGDIPVWDGVVGEWVCDFDQDTLADIDCLDGQLIRWSADSTGWVCADDVDTMLSEDEVDDMVADNGYAMASEIFSGSFLDLVDVAPGLADGDDDTQLTADEVDAIVADNGYAMATDVFSGSFTALTDVPAGLEDGDTTLTEDEVDAYVADDIAALATDVDTEVASLLAEIATLQDQVAALEEDADPGADSVMYGDYIIENSIDLNTLEGYSTVTGDLTINAGPLPNISALHSLTTVGGDLNIYRNTALTDLSGLENLTTVGGSFDMERNSALTSTSALENLSVVGDKFRAYMNDRMVVLSGPLNLEEVSELYVSSNNLLEEINGFNTLTTISSGLTLNGYYLRDISGMENITSIGGRIWIKNADSLVNLDAFESLTNVGGLDFDNNDVLTDISGLSNISTTTGEGASFTFEWNESLCTSDVTALSDLIGHLFTSGWVRYNRSC
jgi:hypothetical protein